MTVNLLSTAAAGMATLLAAYLLLGEQVGATPPNTATEVYPQLSGLTKSQAEDLLDWLEAQGRSGCTIRIDETGYFAVHLPQTADPE